MHRLLIFDSEMIVEIKKTIIYRVFDVENAARGTPGKPGDEARFFIRLRQIDCFSIVQG